MEQVQVFDKLRSAPHHTTQERDGNDYDAKKKVALCITSIVDFSPDL